VDEVSQPRQEFVSLGTLHIARRSSRATTCRPCARRQGLGGPAHVPAAGSLGHAILRTGSGRALARSLERSRLLSAIEDIDAVRDALGLGHDARAKSDAEAIRTSTIVRARPSWSPRHWIRCPRGRASQKNHPLRCPLAARHHRHPDARSMISSPVHPCRGERRGNALTTTRMLSGETASASSVNVVSTMSASSNAPSATSTTSTGAARPAGVR